MRRPSSGCRKDPRYNSTMRTTCVATMLSGGHAPNALPQRAEANVNCRIFPGHSQEEIRLQLVKLFDDPTAHRCATAATTGELSDHGSDRKAMAPPPLRADVMNALRERVAEDVAGGAGVAHHGARRVGQHLHHECAGIPSYGISGVRSIATTMRAHGKDERVKIDVVLHAASSSIICF